MYNLGQKITPDQAMRYAIETAKLGRGFVSPNPLVGSVIVDKDHQFLSAGAHLRYGGAHAEVNAINSVGDASLLVGATIYVTLQPCSHFGKTPPCTRAIIDAKISKVCYGTPDPNPLAAGEGLKGLRDSGVEVEHYARYEDSCLETSEQYFYHIQNRKPYLSIKVGASLDGKIALQSGESQWITGEEARLHARQLRGHYDATLIGAGTLHYDNPTLDFRGTGFEGQKGNKIIILDPKGKAAENFKETKIYKTHGAKNIYVLTRADHVDKWSKNLTPVIRWEATHQGWGQALENLYQKGICSIYVEGGSYVFGQMLHYRLPQKLYLFQSNKIVGKGVSWSQYFETGSLTESLSLKKWSSIPISEDHLNIAYFD